MKMLGRATKWGYRSPFRSAKKRMNNIEERTWQEDLALEAAQELEAQAEEQEMLGHQNKFDNHWVVKYLEDHENS